MGLREEIGALHEMPDSELEWWCQKEGDGRYGTWASVVRALTWLRRGATERALVDIDRALAKTPCFEWIELVCAMLLYVAGAHERSIALLSSIATHHRRLTPLATKLARERVARRGNHESDGRDLAQAASLILRAAGQEKSAAPKSAGVPVAAFDDHRSLANADIERFIKTGWIRLRKAFSRDTATAVIAEAQRRIQHEPEPWISDRGELRAEDLRGFAPDDPATWPHGRLDLRGPSRFPIATFSPYADRAIDQLLRGCARATTVWSDDLIIQFPIEVDVWRPRPNSPAWHLDSPSQRTRLSELRTGLLVLVLYSDLLANSGNTWICPDSVPAVARALAAHPEGMDFCDVNTAPAITSRCRRFEQVTGDAGDVILLHPLILHSASPNPSPRIRWATNPMIYLDEPLDHTRPDPSPVELAIARALIS